MKVVFHGPGLQRRRESKRKSATARGRSGRDDSKGGRGKREIDREAHSEVPAVSVEHGGFDSYQKEEDRSDQFGRVGERGRDRKGTRREKPSPCPIMSVRLTLPRLIACTKSRSRRIGFVSLSSRKVAFESDEEDEKEDELTFDVWTRTSGSGIQAILGSKGA